jgi:hypothetical protein
MRNHILFLNYPTHFHVFFYLLYICIKNYFLLFIISESFHLILKEDTSRPKPSNSEHAVSSSSPI